MIREIDREAAVQRVQDAYSDGRLSHDEMDQRLHQVLSATTHNEIDRAIASLPPSDPGRSLRIGAATGRIRRSGAWQVPRRLTVASAFGRVQLDLTRAIFEHHELDIELKLGTGGATIRVPRDAVVNVDGVHTAMKDSQYQPPRHSNGAGPRIRITGTLGFGRLRIRHARR
ncbi:DUF1707 domain-containing protein [Kribbella sp. NPDC026611]|uniref:DUF1707 SHOCT-like domain-containing protein n=1 Tax=Kribbella sp. NPDC026611 TaxID=3154911 RepID=UPI0033C5DB52